MPCGSLEQMEFERRTRSTSRKLACEAFALCSVGRSRARPADRSSRCPSHQVAKGGLMYDELPIIVTGDRRRTIQMIEHDLKSDARNYTIVNSIEGIMGRRGDVYTYALYRDLDLKREFEARCRAGWLKDRGMP